MTQPETEAVELLSQLGLSTQEGRVYIALLQEGPVTPYRVAKTAGIPAGKIYDIVQRLAARGLVTEVSGTTSGLVAKDPEAALREIADHYENTARAAADSLKALGTRQRHQVAWNVEGEEEVVLQGRRIIQDAATCLSLAAPPGLMARWLDGTAAQVPPELEVRLFATERPAEAPPAWKWRRLTPANSMKVLKNGAVITADRSMAFFVSAVPGGYRGSWIENSAIVAMADDYIASLIFIEDVFDNQWIPWGEV